MKTFKYIISAILITVAIWSCTDDEFGNIDFLSTASAPEKVSALYHITQDNTGLVTITPNGEGTSSYAIYFGDNTVNPVSVKQGESVKHVYAEGTYKVKIIGTGITGLKTEVIQDLVVSFIAPKNLVVVIENDKSTSKKVNVTANADYATFFEVYFGEAGTTAPVTANIGGTASYIYKEAGKYTIRVVAKGGAIKTTEESKEFDVTAILAPTVAAPIPPSRLATDVVSIFSDKYTNIHISEWNPGWGQSTTLEEVLVEGNKTLKYGILNYTGIVTDYGNPTNLSSMEYVRFDYWTPNATFLKLKIVNEPAGGPKTESELAVGTIELGQWKTVEIPLSSFTTAKNGVIQLIFSSDNSNIFIDNLYFYKAPTPSSNLPTSSILSLENYKELSSFDGGDLSVVANPSKNGNSSDFVAKMVKSSGQTWAGSKITFTDQLTFTNETTVKVKVWSPRIGLKLLLKFEDATPWPNTVASAEVVATTTKANQWEELTFDFSGISTSTLFTNLILIMDNGTMGDGTSNYTIYVDDIKQFLSSNSSTILDFENYKELSSFDGGDLSVVANPSRTGNSSDFVAKLVKGSGQTWAGSKITFNDALTFTSETTVKMKVWSPRVGLKLLAKFEDATPWPDTKASAEVTATTTKANQWEELTFDFSGISTSLNFVNLVLIMDNGTAGDGTATYTIYVDDIKQF